MSVEIVHGDCLEIMTAMGDGSVDAIVTDPPYGVGLGVGKDKRGGKHGLGKDAYLGSGDTYDEFVAEIVPRLNLALAKAKRAAVFTGPHIQEQAKATAIGGVYCPAGSGRHAWGFKTFLPILFYGKAPDLNKGAKPNILKSSARSEKNGHPCPKPLEWMLWLVQLTTRPGELVVDPFCGSGTTAVACAMTGRRFIGIEREATYVEIARRRLAEMQPDLLGAA